MAVATDPALALNLVRRVCAGDLLTRSAARFGDRPAIVDGDITLTYRELDRRANAVGRALLGLGLERQELVGVLSRNSWELVVTYFACAKAGLIAQPVNLGLKPEEMGWCLEQTEVRVLVVEPELAAMAEALPPIEHRFVGLDELLAGDDSPLEVLVEDRDAVQCLYTSGTTSLPKGVLTSHLAVTITALSAALVLRCDHRDTVVIPLPLFHTAALNAILMSALAMGTTVVLLPGYDPESLADVLDRRRATYALLLPFMWQDLLARPDIRERDWSAMRLCVYGMAQMAPEKVDEAREVFGADVLLGSGMTEFSPPTTFQHVEHQSNKSGSWGPPSPTVDVRIMGEEGELLPTGEIGEIVYRGAHCMNGYLGSPEANEEAFRDGWFRTGDVGYLDDEGVVWFTDRKKDMIKTGGENVASIEVERCLLSHPGVSEAAVVGLQDERWGEAVTAFVVATATAEEITSWCRERLAPFKVPKRVVLVEEFPRTGTGKIQKHALRELA